MKEMKRHGREDEGRLERGGGKSRMGEVELRIGEQGIPAQIYQHT